MSPTSRTSTIETLVCQLSDVMSAHVQTYVSIWEPLTRGREPFMSNGAFALEHRRAELYLQSEEIAFAVPPAPITAPSKLDLPEDN